MAFGIPSQPNPSCDWDSVSLHLPHHCMESPLPAEPGSPCPSPGPSPRAPPQQSTSTKGFSGLILLSKKGKRPLGVQEAAGKGLGSRRDPGSSGPPLHIAASCCSWPTKSRARARGSSMDLQHLQRLLPRGRGWVWLWGGRRRRCQRREIRCHVRGWGRAAMGTLGTFSPSCHQHPSCNGSRAEPETMPAGTGAPALLHGPSTPACLHGAMG